MSVYSEMILIEFLLAPTVPSEPRPKNTARLTPSISALKLRSGSSDRWVTSSMMPTVKCGFGSLFFSSSKTALAIELLNSFDDRP